MRQATTRRWTAGALSLVAAGLLFGCTSSGDGGVGPIDDELSRGADIVQGPNQFPDAESVFLVEASSSRDVFCADVAMGSVTNLFAVAFQLEYDAQLMEFRGFTAGPFLGASSEILVEVDEDEDPVTGIGTLTVGVSRLAGGGGVTGCTLECGDGPLITLCWDLVGNGTSQLDFVGNLAGFPPDSTDPADQILDASDFFDNSVVITQ